MNVSELIELLQRQPGDAEVLVGTLRGQHGVSSNTVTVELVDGDLELTGVLEASPVPG